MGRVVVVKSRFNFTGPNRMDAAMNLLLTTVIIILMVIFSLRLSSSVSAIVLRPLEKLLDQVKDTASKIFKSETTMAKSIVEEAQEAAVLGDDEGDEYGHRGVAFGAETVLLERVVQKLAVMSEITMKKSTIDAVTMEQMGEGDRAVLQGMSGGGVQVGGSGMAQSWALKEGDFGLSGYEYTRVAAVEALENAGLPLSTLVSWDFNPLELDDLRNTAAVIYCLGPPITTGSTPWT